MAVHAFCLGGGGMGVGPHKARWINIKETRTGLAIERIS
jgi:hypothetical protein